MKNSNTNQIVQEPLPTLRELLDRKRDLFLSQPDVVGKEQIMVNEALSFTCAFAQVSELRKSCFALMEELKSQILHSNPMLKVAFQQALIDDYLQNKNSL